MIKRREKLVWIEISSWAREKSLGSFHSDSFLFISASLLAGKKNWLVGAFAKHVQALWRDQGRGKKTYSLSAQKI